MQHSRKSKAHVGALNLLSSYARVLLTFLLSTVITGNIYSYAVTESIISPEYVSRQEGQRISNPLFFHVNGVRDIGSLPSTITNHGSSAELWRIKQNIGTKRISVFRDSLEEYLGFLDWLVGIFLIIGPLGLIFLILALSSREEPLRLSRLRAFLLISFFAIVTIFSICWRTFLADYVDSKSGKYIEVVFDNATTQYFDIVIGGKISGTLPPMTHTYHRVRFVHGLQEMKINSHDSDYIQSFKIEQPPIYGISVFNIKRRNSYRIICGKYRAKW